MDDDSVTEQTTQKVDLTNLKEHKDIKKGFVHVLNAVRPEHSYLDSSQIYPIREYEIKYSYKKSTSSYYASCGPRGTTRMPVFFAADREALSQKSPERNLSIYVHELTHLSVGSHSSKQSGSHPPRFWREYAFNSHKALDNWGYLERTLGTPLSKEDFIGHIVNDEINRFNIDLRYHDVGTLQHQMARWFEDTLR